MSKSRISSAILSAVVLGLLWLVLDADTGMAKPLIPHCVKRSAVKSTSASDAVLDFDGDGLSDLTTSKDIGNQTVFTIVLSSTSQSRTVALPNGRAAPADYDGDGIWDPAIVRLTERGMQWVIKLSSTGSLAYRTFGPRGAGLITGCRLTSDTRYSLAYTLGRKIVASELGTTATRTISTTALRSVDFFGCGDLTGDGVDETVFRTRKSSTTLDDLATVSCQDDIVVYRSLPIFSGGLVIRRPGTDLPVAAISRPRSDTQRTLQIAGFYDTLSFAPFIIPNGAGLSSAIVSDGASGRTAAVWWHDRTKNMIVQQLFSAPRTKSVLARDVGNVHLLRPQNVYKPLS